jgi:hypothetical protein
MTTAIANISKDVSMITRSNRQHLEASAKVLHGIKEIQKVSTENAGNAKTLTSDSGGLTDRAQRLAQLTVSMETGNRSNGSTVPTARKKARKAANSEGA